MINENIIDTFNFLFTLVENMNDNSDVNSYDFDKDLYYVCKVEKIDNYNLIKNDIKFEVKVDVDKHFNIKELFEINSESDVYNFHFQNNIIFNVILHILVINRFISFTNYNNYNLTHKVEIKKDKKEDILVKTFKSYDYEHLVINLNRLVSLLYPYLDRFALMYKNTIIKRFDAINKNIDFELQLTEDNKNVSIRMVNSCDLIAKKLNQGTYEHAKVVEIKEISKTEFLNFFKLIKNRKTIQDFPNKFRVKSENVEFNLSNKNANEGKQNTKRFKNKRAFHKNKFNNNRNGYYYNNFNHQVKNGYINKQIGKDENKNEFKSNEDGEEKLYDLKSIISKKDLDDLI